MKKGSREPRVLVAVLKDRRDRRLLAQRWYRISARRRLLASRELLRLYEVPHIERILLRAVRRAGFPARPQVAVAGKGWRP